ncbi:MAG: riboflavin kinase / adenylyltransferase [Frankiaceae bacterium]|nr:riboflavin kinase / adenylyltransferase [Frankiaceae bacterium]
MRRWRDPSEVPEDWGRSVVAIGVFDGVHLGHRAIVARAIEAARSLDASSVVVTFDPHPARVVRPEAAPLLLGSVPERVELLASLGIDAVLVLPFDREMSSWTAEEFVQRLLVSRLHARRVVVGENFRFGNRALGDVALLRSLGAADGFDVDAVGLVGDGDAVSSTLVRGLVAAGDVAGALRALGRPYALSGVVVRGDARGRALGYPTANLAIPAGIAVPADGVYAGWLVRADGSRWPAAVSVGSNPTFDGVERRVEAYALDAEFDLYDERITVEFAERLRGMEKFDSVDTLVAQMAADVAEVRRKL